MLEVLQKPWVEYRNEVHALEIAIVTPMKGMFQQSDKLWKELSKYVSTQKIAEEGAYYLRFRLIDMEGDMGISVGVPVPAGSGGNERVRPIVLPQGQYACLRYIGHGLVANKLLLNWIKDQGLQMDRWDDPKGDAFRCRRETFLTDRRKESLKKKWAMELSIKLADMEKR
jgi:effector-binding domain-containing protein